jgi:transcriptional regulator with GAF, ATPase, and Fis domain
MIRRVTPDFGVTILRALGDVGVGHESDRRERLMLIERQILLETLDRANGIRKRAAEMLRIDSRNMPYFLRKHHLQDKIRP